MKNQCSAISIVFDFKFNNIMLVHFNTKANHTSYVLLNANMLCYASVSERI